MVRTGIYVHLEEIHLRFPFSILLILKSTLNNLPGEEFIKIMFHYLLASIFIEENKILFLSR